MEGRPAPMVATLYNKPLGKASSRFLKPPRLPRLPIPCLWPHSPPSLPPHSPHTPLKDGPKAQVNPKRLGSTAPPVSTPLSPASSGALQPSRGRERWGGWLGSSLGSQQRGGQADSSKQNCANSTPLQTSELRSSGFDMTKLYPELSAKLGLTKQGPGEGTSIHKNGITLRENLAPGPLKKLETVTDDSRIKVVSTGQIFNNTKGLVTAKLGSGVPNSKAGGTAKASSRSRIKCGERGQRRGSHGRSGVRPEVGGSHGQSSAPVKGPSIARSAGSLKSNSNSSSAPNSSSILEEQLRGGGSSQRHMASPGSGLHHHHNHHHHNHNHHHHHHHHHHHSRLPQPATTRPVPLTASSSSSSSSISSNVSSGRSLVTSPSTTATTTTHLAALSSQEPRVVTLPPRQPPQSFLSSAAAASLPQPLLRVHALREKHYAYKSDLFPLGIETSEESESSDAEELCGSQQGWLDPTDGAHLTYQSWEPSWTHPNNLPHLPRLSSSPTVCQRSVTLALALASCRRQVSASRMRSDMRSREVARLGVLTRLLLETARTHPRLTAAACCLYRPSQAHQESPKVKSRFMSSVLVRRPCVYRDGECREPSLPGTRHCMHHIMYNVDQQLFTHCTARHPDNTLCRVPVFDVSHELPLCYKHSKTQENVAKTPTDETSKPKRSRKKNKMPILSRYGKRSKKRRRSSNSSSSVIPSTSVRPPMASQSSLSSPQPSPTTPQTSPHFSTASCTDSVAEVDEESELEEDMEGMVEGLDAASRLLDPRDLQDVLNRIPDHELTQLFDAPEAKTSDFSEEKVEIEGEQRGTGRGEDHHDSGRSPVSAHSPSPCPATLTPAPTPTAASSSTPPLNEEGTTLSLDESTFNELVAGNIPIDSIISSSFNQQELNTISQALSNIVQESNLNLPGFDLPTSSGSSFTPSEAVGAGQGVGDVSDSSLMSQGSDVGVGQAGVDLTDSSHLGGECKVNLGGQRAGSLVGADASTLSPLK
ncbi:hypothetical protein O3P69_000131 [Scylla paramamosain]|uniref:KANL2-like probable zinc-finger domain-containing protein n=1 Tax=Scylla paramamosain TaxID=85552 RepID=A0AAW0UX69_SCYPA